MDDEDLLRKIKGVKALIDDPATMPGERETAKRMYAKLCKKAGINPDTFNAKQHTRSSSSNRQSNSQSNWGPNDDIFDEFFRNRGFGFGSDFRRGGFENRSNNQNYSRQSGYQEQRQTHERAQREARERAERQREREEQERKDRYQNVRPKMNWKWAYVSNSSHKMSFKDGKGNVHETTEKAPKATQAQVEYVLSICSFYDIQTFNMGDMITFECAAHFLDVWAARFEYDKRNGGYNYKRSNDW